MFRLVPSRSAQVDFRLRKLWLFAGTVLLLVIHLCILAIFGHRPVVQVLSAGVLAASELLCAAVCFLAARDAHANRHRVWQLLGYCLVLASTVGTLAIYDACRPGHAAVGMALRMLLFFTTAPMFVAIFLSEDELERPISWEWILDTLQILILFLVIYLFFSFIPALIHGQQAMRTKLDWLFFSRDLLMIAGLYMRAAFSRSRQSQRLFLGVALVLTFFSFSSLIAYRAQDTSSAPEVSWYDLVWTTCFCLIAMLAARWKDTPEPSEPPRIPDVSRVVLAYLPSLIIPVILLVNYHDVVREQIFVGLLGIVVSMLLFNARLLLTLWHQKRIMGVLHATEQQYRALFERNMAGVFRGTLEGKLLECNAAFAAMLGYAREELRGISMDDLYFGGAPERNLEICAVRQDGLTPREVRLRRKDGSPLWVVVNANLQRLPDGEELLEGMMIDITESKLSRLVLEDWKRRYGEAVLASRQIIYESDPKSQFVELDGCTGEILGYTPAELSGEAVKWLELIHPADRSDYVEKMRAAATAEGIEFEYRVRRKDGSYRTLWEQGRAVTDAEGNVTRITGFITDITERRALEAQFRQAQKMEAVGRLAGGIAHDFNNILTVISGYSSIQLDRSSPSDPVHHEAEQIRATAERAAALTRQLLAFSRQQVMLPRRLNLNDIVRNLDKMLRRLIGENIEVMMALAPDLGAVKVDPGQMDQVVMNLVINARDAMPDGGKLTIQTQNIELDESYFEKHGYVISPRQVMLAISDNGTGMAPETQARLFEPFFTTKEAGKGTGLGLPVVYGIVKQSGGSIEVYSELNHGTTVKIYLPRVDSEVEQLLPASFAADTRARGAERVLLVEDDMQLRHLVATILTSRGYTVEAVERPEELEYILEHTPRCSLLLTDVVMPKLSGPEVARRVQKRWPEAKVLYMSGYTTNAIVHHGVLDEGLFFLQKPFRPSDLAAKVREVLDHPPTSKANSPS